MEVGTKLIGYETTIYLLDTLQMLSYLGTPGSGKEILTLIGRRFPTRPCNRPTLSSAMRHIEPNLSQTTNFIVRFKVFENQVRFCGAAN